jgi:mannose-6-phosphate isomerase-like protein (cupin superfamily)
MPVSRCTFSRATKDSRRDSPPWRSPCRPRFAGPIPQAHDEFDEGIYVISGRLLVSGDDEPAEAVPGSMFVAARGHRHGFSNPSGEPARVLGLWAPAAPALAFMRDIGAALRPDTPPDPDRVREIY